MDVKPKHLQAVLFGKVREYFGACDSRCEGYGRKVANRSSLSGHAQEYFLWREEQKKQAKQEAKISIIS